MTSFDAEKCHHLVSVYTAYAAEFTTIICHRCNQSGSWAAFANKQWHHNSRGWSQVRLGGVISRRTSIVLCSH